MITFRMKTISCGTISKSGQPVGGFWDNGDGRWWVRIDGFSVALVASKSQVRNFTHRALTG